MDSKLNFNENTQVVYKKCQQRMYFLRKLRKLNLDSKVLKNFYICHVQTILTFSFLAWYGSLTVANTSALRKVVTLGSKLCGIQCEGLQKLYEHKARKKAISIINDQSHALAHHFQLLPSGRRYKVPMFTTNRAQRSFIPSAIRLLNQTSFN